MNVQPIIQAARSRVEHRLPRTVRFDDVVREAYTDIVDSVAERVQYALESAMLGAQSILKSKSEDYIEALKINEDLTIGLEAKAEYLEEGYGAYPQLPDLATGPKSKTAADGSRYVIVPIGKKEAVNVRDAMSKKASEVVGSSALRAGSSRKIQDMVMQMSETLKMARNTGPVEAQGFAVASTKQDVSTWEHPGFQGVRQLSSINAQLKSDLESAVGDIIEAAARRMA